MKTTKKLRKAHLRMRTLQKKLKQKRNKRNFRTLNDELRGHKDKHQTNGTLSLINDFQSDIVLPLTLLICERELSFIGYADGVERLSF